MVVKTYSQTLNFTIDTAVDNGTNITETIVDGVDTYVLTIDHSIDVENIDKTAGSDWLFYLGSSTTSAPFTLSITKNGAPIYFTLNGLDYDTLRTGNISLENQDNSIIAASNSYTLGAGSIVISNPANAVDISNFKIIPATITDLSNFAFHNVNITVGATLSIEDANVNNNVQIYPNPSRGKIAINSSGIILKDIEISDLKGRVISNYKLGGINNTKQLNLPELSSGVYLININSDKGTIVRKLIIE